MKLIHVKWEEEETVDRMQIVIYFGGARSLWWALFVYFLFVKNQHFFLKALLIGRCGPSVIFCLFFSMSDCNFVYHGVPNVCNIPTIVLFYFIFLVLPSLLLHNGFGCMWSENLMAISVLRVFAYLHVSSQMKKGKSWDCGRCVGQMRFFFFVNCGSNKWWIFRLKIMDCSRNSRQCV